jgi:hypothetical protein
MTTPQKASELIERYVHAVGEQLPRKQREDVTAELRSLLNEKLDERALDAGRSPDEEMAAAILREFGQPEEIAERYQPAPRYLIGPRLYPAFLLTTKVVLSVVGILLMIGAALQVAFGRGLFRPEFTWEALWDGIGWVARVLLVNVAIVAGVFAILERLQARSGGSEESRAAKWDPRELPQQEDPERVSAPDRVWRVYCIVVLFIVLNFSPQYFGVVFFTDDGLYTLPVFEMGVRIPVSLLDVWWVLALALNMTLLRLGRWNFSTRAWEFGLGLFGAGILFLILNGSTFITDANWFAEHGWVESERVARLAERALPLANRVLRGALWLALFITLLSSVQRAWRLSTRYRGQWGRMLGVSVW